LQSENRVRPQRGELQCVIAPAGIVAIANSKLFAVHGHVNPGQALGHRDGKIGLADSSRGGNSNDFWGSEGTRVN